MTEMSETQQIIDSARTTIARGGIYEHRAAGGAIVVKLFYVSGGSFCRVDTRAASGGPCIVELSGTYQFESQAVARFAATLAYLTERTTA